MTFEVTIEIDTKWAVRIGRAAWCLRFAIGRERAQRLTYWVAWRLARWRIGAGRWRRMENRS